MLLWVLQLWARYRVNGARWWKSWVWLVRHGVFGQVAHFTKRPKRPCLVLKGTDQDQALLDGFVRWFEQDLEVIQLYAYSPVALDSYHKVEFVESRQVFYPRAVLENTAMVGVQPDFLLICGDVIGNDFPPMLLKSGEIFFFTGSKLDSELMAALDCFAHSSQRSGK